MAWPRSYSVGDDGVRAGALRSRDEARYADVIRSIRSNCLAGAGIASLMLASCVAKPAPGLPGPRSFHGVPLAPNVTCGDANCNGFNVVPYVRERSRYGIGCLGDVPPGTLENAERPPQSYSVNDIGKPGFPKLRIAERELVKRIRNADDSHSLRIAWVDDASTPDNFIVFDATDGPCEVAAGGYPVLNGGCNEFYQPGENPYFTHPAPSCFPTNRPWMNAAGSR